MTTRRSAVAALVAGLTEVGCACRTDPLACCLLHWSALVGSLPERDGFHLARNVFGFDPPPRSWSR